MPPICHDSESEERRRLHKRWLQELSESHVPTHDFKDEPEASDPRCDLSPEIAPPGYSHEKLADHSVQQDDPVLTASNLDRCSLRSSTENTTSTSSASLSQSSGTWSTSVTVSSAPTSMSSKSGGITAVNIVELEKGVFAAPKLALELKDRSAWEKIQPRLQHTIDNTLQIRQSLESTISFEFMMGGPSPKQLRLKPTIFLVCCHEIYRKQLRTIMKRQKWMKEYGYQCVIIVDDFEELSFGNMHDISDTDVIHIEASLPKQKISLCGLGARAQARSHDTPVKFTIGGSCLSATKPSVSQLATSLRSSFYPRFASAKKKNVMIRPLWPTALLHSLDLKRRTQTRLMGFQRPETWRQIWNCKTPLAMKSHLLFKILVRTINVRRMYGAMSVIFLRLRLEDQQWAVADSTGASSTWTPGYKPFTVL